MKITRKFIEEKADQYAHDYCFDEGRGWEQVRRDLRPPPAGSEDLPRAIAYGAYMALIDLLEM